MGKGFILDDWDIGFQSDIKLHRTPTADDIQDGYEEDELIDIDEVKQNIANIEAELAEVQAKMAEYMKELGL